jgi:hypothetical protein
VQPWRLAVGCVKGEREGATREERGELKLLASGRGGGEEGKRWREGFF